MDNLILGKKPPLIREVAAMIFGLVFVLLGGYSTLEIIFGLFCLPFLLAGLVRLLVIVYRLSMHIFNNTLVGLILVFVAFGCVTNALGSVSRFSVILCEILLFVLTIVEAWFFIRDVKEAFRHRKDTENQYA